MSERARERRGRSVGQSACKPNALCVASRCCRYKHLQALPMDTVKWSRKQPKNDGLVCKRARHNCCFTDLQEPVADPDAGDVQEGHHARHKHPKNPRIKVCSVHTHVDMHACVRACVRACMTTYVSCLSNNNNNNNDGDDDDDDDDDDMKRVSVTDFSRCLFFFA